MKPPVQEKAFTPVFCAIVGANPGTDARQGHQEDRARREQDQNTAP